MAEGLATEVDLFLCNELSKPDKFDDREVRLNNLTTAVSSIVEAVSKLERDVSVLDSKSFSKRTQGKPELLRGTDC